MAAVTLGLGRALGEAIAVTQVIGNSLRPFPLSLFGQGNTLASQLASSYQSAPTNIELSSLVYLGLILLVITFVTNLAAQRIVHRFERAALGSQVVEPISLRATGRSRRRLLVSNGRGRRRRSPRPSSRSGSSSSSSDPSLRRASTALNWAFFTKGPAVFGETGGGIAPAFVGTLMLVAIATAIALPIGVLVALYVSEFAPAAAGGADEALARRPERIPLDRDRHLRLRADRRRVVSRPRNRSPPERLGRRVRALDHHGPARRAHGDGGARTRPEPPPRSQLRARRVEVADGR